VYHSDWGRIVATLIGLFGDFELAEEAAQEAFVAAVDQWRTEGVPEFPRAWIIQTAKFKPSTACGDGRGSAKSSSRTPN
jgi:RNA polymerase sigma-70 factor (ECF subfamily)